MKSIFENTVITLEQIKERNFTDKKVLKHFSERFPKEETTLPELLSFFISYLSQDNVYPVEWFKNNMPFSNNAKEFFDSNELLAELEESLFTNNYYFYNGDLIIHDCDEFILDNQILIVKGKIQIEGELILRNQSYIIAGSLDVQEELICYGNSRIFTDKIIESSSIYLRGNTMMRSPIVKFDFLELNETCVINGCCYGDTMLILQTASIYGNVILEEYLFMKNSSKIYGNVTTFNLTGRGNCFISGEILVINKCVIGKVLYSSSEEYPNFTKLMTNSNVYTDDDKPVFSTPLIEKEKEDF